MNGFDSEQLKNRIENSQIFVVDKNEMPYRYKILLYEFVEDIYGYLNTLSPKYNDMGLEIVETVNSCLKSYDRNSGAFINYFMASLKHQCPDFSKEPIISNVLIAEDEMDLFDLVAHEISAEEQVLENLAIDDVLKQTENLISEYDDSTRGIVSMLITAKLIKDSPELVERSKYSFINQRVLNAYIDTGQIVSARDIASLYGRNEASISRTYKRFVLRLKAVVYEERGR